MRFTLKIHWLRQLVFLSLLGVIGYGCSSKEAWGTCDICPIGLLGVSMAGKMLLPQAIVLIGLEVIAVVVLGKLFCSWVCPTSRTFSKILL